MVLLRFSILASLCGSLPLFLSHTHAYAHTIKHNLSFSLSHTHTNLQIPIWDFRASSRVHQHTHALLSVTYTNWKTYANTQTYITDTNSPCHTNIDRDRNTVTKSHSDIQPHSHTVTQPHSHTATQSYSPTAMLISPFNSFPIPISKVIHIYQVFQFLSLWL